MKPSEVPADIAAVDAAWSAFEQGLLAFGQRIRELTPTDARARYEGYRAALALLSDNYVSQLYAEPARAEFLPYIGLVSNYAGPTPDMNYYLVLIEPGLSYRVWGMRGSAQIIDVQQLAGWFGQDAREQMRTKSFSSLDDAGIAPDAAGNIEFVLSPQKTPQDARPWLKLEDGVKVLLLREYFTDYATQQDALLLHIERLDGVRGERDLSSANGVQRLNALTRAIEQYGFTFSLSRGLAHQLGNNVFRVEDFSKDAGQANQAYIQARYDVPPGYALVGEWVVPPASSYWSFALYSDLYQTLDYVECQSSLNNAQARVSEGVFRFVVADFDPGIANWLALDGHRSGLLLLRAKQAPQAQAPTVRLVARDALDAALTGMDRVDPAQREADLAVRRQHYLRRMRR